MVGRHTTLSDQLEHWSPTLVLAAGVLFVGHAAVRGIEAFTSMPPPVDVFGPTGYVAAILGLLGLHSSLADRTPTISRIAALTAVITVPAWVLIAGSNFGEAAGILPPPIDVLPEGFFVLVIVTTLLVYLLFGVACLNANRHTRTLGGLLLAPAALLGLLLVGSVALPIAPAAGGVVIGSGLALTHGAIGGTLLTGRARGDHMTASADVTPE
jgi:hypothetical protein